MKQVTDWGKMGGQIARAGTQLTSRAPVGQKFLYLMFNALMKRVTGRLICETNFGARFSCDTRDFIQRMICNFGVWEPDITSAISRILQPGDVFVDVGANVGYYSLLASSLVGENGRVFSIEPHPLIFATLQQNIALNTSNNIIPLRIAVSRIDGQLELYSGPTASLGESTTVANRGFRPIGLVTTRPLSKIVPNEYLSRTALIKIDVEGAEADVLLDVIDNIDLFPDTVKIIVEMATDNPERLELFSRMTSLGFKAYAVSNNYDDLYYMNWAHPTLPHKIQALPDEQVDIVFSRMPLEHIFGA